MKINKVHMLRGKRILITGATGFVGSHLAAKLIKLGAITHVLIRPSSNTHLLDGIKRQLKVYRYDGSVGSVMRAMKKARPQIVFHIAALYISEHRPKEIAPLVESNLLFGTQIVEAMARYNVRCLVNTGTSWQHYQNKDYSPVNLYAATKQAFETIIQYYIEAFNLRVITLKLSNTYGPNDDRKRLLCLLEQAIQTRKPLKMSPGKQRLDLVHISDVVNAYLIAANRLMAGQKITHERFAVISGEAQTVRQIVKKIEQALGRRLKIHWGGRPYRLREVMKSWTKGVALPGWKPTVSFDGKNIAHGYKNWNCE